VEEQTESSNPLAVDSPAMPDGREPITVRVLDRIDEIAAAEWDACAGDDNPFLSHAFLDALEASGSATAETGWLPRHLVITDSQGRLEACAPLYLKGHSYGEYVFDHAWADAYERAGGQYYPKLQCAVPFTPVTGPRLLVRPDADRPTLTSALIAGLLELARQSHVSGLHVTFPLEAEWRAFADAGFLLRQGLQYHWDNRDYGSFEDFLGELVSRKRKAIRKERREVAATGVVLRRLCGDDIKPAHWDAFYRFYRSTTDKRWGYPYLTRDFFDLLGKRLAHRVVLVIAEYDGEPVAGALNLQGSDTLYGRNWGAVARFKHLHFEACYYQAIEHAIACGLRRVEAGAQGQHKIQRGYLPQPTYSAHWIRDRGLARAIESFLERERRHVDHEIALLAEESPFRENSRAG
jgi:predicted N-acyltransferase